MTPLPASPQQLYATGPVQKTAAGSFHPPMHAHIQPLDAFVQGHESNMIQLSVYEIIWVKKGAGSLTADLHDITLEENKVYLLRPGHLRYMQLAGKAEGYYISLSPGFFQPVAEEAGWPLLSRRADGPVIVDADEEIMEEAEAMLRKIGKELEGYGISRLPILKGLFKIFMLYLAQKVEVVPSKGLYCAEQELTNRFMQLLGNNFTTKKLVANYAAELCVTPGHLNRIVKKMSGFPVSHHIQQQIIFEAKKQARYSGKSMKQIAYSLGFDDTAHFSKYFKNNSGMNFSNFKKIAFL